MWHVGQASREGDVSKAKQLLRRLKDEAVLKEAVEGAEVKTNYSSLIVSLAFIWFSGSVFAACALPQSPVVPYIKDSFFCL